VGLAQLVYICTCNGFAGIDCQLPTPHLESLGSRAIARVQFQSLLREHLEVAPRPLVR
jgi:leucyl/phenylalanyl-tRNA--protein transferase